MPNRVRIPAGLLALMLLAFCSCAEERPTQPGPTRYLVYADFTGDRVWEDSNGVFHAEYTHRLYIYSADSNLALVDSINMEVGSSQIAVSPDGRWLYRKGGEAFLDKWDLRTKQKVWTVPGGGSICLLRSGQWILRADRPGGSQVFRAADGLPIGAIPDTLEVGWGPVSGTKVAVHNKNVIRILDVATGEISGSWLPMLSDGTTLKSVYRRLHPDGRRVAVIGMRGLIQDSWFAVGDVLTGETLLEHRLIYPYGQISISDDGRYATATDPSRFLIYDSYPTLDIFDLETNTHLRRFSFPTDTISYIGQALFIPGEDCVVATTEAGLYRGGGPLYSISLSRLAIEQITWSPLHFVDTVDGFVLHRGASTGGISVGPRP